MCTKIFHEKKTYLKFIIYFITLPKFKLVLISPFFCVRKRFEKYFQTFSEGTRWNTWYKRALQRTKVNIIKPNP